MGFYLSPSVNVRETDLSGSVPASATSTTAMVGQFAWGPCFERTLITTEKELSTIFGANSDTVYLHWMSAANFLAYGNTLYIVRAVDDGTALNAGIKLFDDTKSYKTIVISNIAGGSFAVADTLTGAPSTATGKILSITGSTVKTCLVEITTGTFTASDTVTNGTATADVDSVADATSPTIGYTVYCPNSTTDVTVTNANSESLAVIAKYPGAAGNNISVSIANSTDFSSATTDGTTLFTDLFDFAPESGQIAVVVRYSGTIVEKMILSLTDGVKDAYNNNIYVDEYTNRYSNYVRIFRGGATETPFSIQYTTLTGGVDGTPANADFQTGWDLFSNVDEIEIDLCIDGGTTNDTMQKYILDNIITTRKDCFGIFCVPKADIVGVLASTATTNCVTYMNTTLNKNSSYYALYPIWKWQYDKYADKYRWIPGSADVAGVIATVDAARAAWFAPAGFNYGQIKNYSKLAYNPNRAQRDTLYKNRINPVCDIPGQGAVILGQKTGLSRPSIFDRISARRLFLVIERAIAKFALSYIMEKNTDENRSRFSTTVRGYLETIRGGEGIADYLVKCDTTNNTPAVLAANQFIADIYVKPTPDAEFIELNFYGVGPNIEISELVK